MSSIGDGIYNPPAAAFFFQGEMKNEKNPSFSSLIFVKDIFSLHQE